MKLKTATKTVQYFRPFPPSQASSSFTWSSVLFIGAPLWKRALRDKCVSETFTLINGRKRMSARTNPPRRIPSHFEWTSCTLTLVFVVFPTGRCYMQTRPSIPREREVSELMLRQPFLGTVVVIPFRLQPMYTPNNLFVSRAERLSLTQP